MSKNKMKTIDYFLKKKVRNDVDGASVENNLDPRDSFSSLNIDDACSLASKYYPLIFSNEPC